MGVSFTRTVGGQAFIRNLWVENPVFRQVLGICSTLAVTNLMKNTVLMCAGLAFTASLSSLTVSFLRNHTPKQVRMMVQVLIIAAYVIVVDIAIRAYFPDVHGVIGPYVGLIITNCIIMGRCEAFATKNPPVASFFDGLGAGIGYSLVLMAIALVREPMGFGTLLGVPLPARDLWWHSWTIMIMPPGAFFMLALVGWLGVSTSRSKTTGGKGHMMFPIAAALQQPDTSLPLQLLVIFLAASLTDNILLTRFLGMCSFLAISRQMKTSLGLGIAVVFVTTCTAALNYLIDAFVLVPLGLEFLRYIIFIVVIAAFVQLVEMIIERFSPPLYFALGIFLPLITVNCAILGVSLFMINKQGYGFWQSLVFGAGSGVGWMLAIVLMAGIRARLKEDKVPEGLRGAGITLLITGIIALAFVGFSGMIKF